MRGWGPQADASIIFAVHQGTSEQILPNSPYFKNVEIGTAYPLHSSDCITVLVSAFVAQVGTMDSVRGLPRNLTEKLIQESLQETVEM